MTAASTYLPSWLPRRTACEISRFPVDAHLAPDAIIRLFASNVRRNGPRIVDYGPALGKNSVAAHLRSYILWATISFSRFAAFIFKDFHDCPDNRRKRGLWRGDGAQVRRAWPQGDR